MADKDKEMGLFHEQKSADAATQPDIPTDTLTQSHASSYSSKASRQEFFIPINGFAWLYPEELHIVDHPAFQRLCRINQLGQTNLVYRGATHKRFEHSLGALQIAQHIIEAVDYNIQKKKDNKEERDLIGDKLNEEEQRFVRLGALLHDIGHVSLGHTIEDELMLISKHDQDKRLDNIFSNNIWRNLDAKTLKELINDEYGKYIPSTLDGKVTPEDLVRLLIRKPYNSEKKKLTKDEEDSNEKYSKKEKEVISSDHFRLDICRNMIGNTICADLLDYLYRDWYHIGKEKFFDERIFQYMEIRKRDNNNRADKNGTRANQQFVLYLGKAPKIRTDGVSAVLELLEWRYQLAEQVLFHRTKLSAASLFDRAIYELKEFNRNGADDLEETILEFSDDDLIKYFLDTAKNKLNEKKDDERIGTAVKMLQFIKNRNLYTALYTVRYGDLSEDRLAKITKLYAGGEEAWRNRIVALRMLEVDFKLPYGSITAYCPTEGMNAKIAEVVIAVGGRIEKFNEYEKRTKDVLSGGHLDAQIKRFKHLWRIHFFIDKRVREQLVSSGMLDLVIEGIKTLILPQEYDENSSLQDDEEQRRDSEIALAKLLKEGKNSHWFGKEITPHSDKPIAAWGDPNVLTKYPTGMVSPRHYFENK